jgi:hypothetical protein
MRKNKKRNDPQAERERIEAALPAWIESMALPGEPFGRFKFHAAQKPPWLLYASQQMLALAIDSGFWTRLDGERRREWLDLLLGTQDGQTGLFVCPVARASDTQTPLNWDSKAYYRAITMKLVRRLSQIGATPRFPLPRADAVCPSYEELPARLAALSWDSNVYTAGSQAGQWTWTRIQELRDRNRDFKQDAYVIRVVNFLESIQDANTGLWGRSPSVEDGVNGLLKTLVVYEELGQPLPRAERILDSLLSLQQKDGSFGEGCSPWNVMTLVTHLARQTTYRLHDLQRAALRLAPALLLRRQPDGLYAFLNDGCMTVHAGVILCDKSQPISDLTGIAQVLSLIKMIDDLARWPGQDHDTSRES